MEKVEVEKNKITTVMMHRSTCDLLDGLAKKGESYEKVVLKLYAFYQKRRANE